ncbi:hypothetical protein SAMN05216557_10481 [Sphingomonas carotinifaciens]|uniref:Uncharacterized protein n=1 Tax=Sphingomonas carotinifaciens TaxID=1166323 RepID=A0A1G7M610_9SPHN|nr:hypothetical protein [Sphingomonas carotinifaciens]SDF57104.1 hypothetical protein SAMN05216557_10481 [Sphingomonas carotinifaciens]
MSRRPDLLGPRHRRIAQQVRTDIMPRCRPRRVRAAVEPFQPHPRCDMQPADLNAFPPGQIAQHPAAGKRVEQVQLVDVPYDGQVGVRHGAWQIVDAATADPELPRLSDQRQRMSTIDHRLAPGNRPASPSGQRAIRQCPLSDFYVQHHDVDRRLGHRRLFRTRPLRPPAAVPASCSRPARPPSDRQSLIPAMPNSRATFRTHDELVPCGLLLFQRKDRTIKPRN